MVLNNAQVGLITNQSGRENWQFLNRASAAKKTTVAKGAAKKAKSASLSGVSISGIEIDHSRFEWLNQQENKKFILNNVNINSSDIKTNHAFPFAISFTVKNNKPAFEADVKAKANVMIDQKTNSYKLSKLDVNGYLERTTSLLKKPMPFRMLGSGIWNAKNQQLTLNKLNVDLADMHATISLNASQVMQAPVYKGVIKLTDQSLANLFSYFRVRHQGDTLKNININIPYEFSAKYLKLPKIDVTVDQSHLLGSVNWTDFNNPEYHYNLKVNQLDLNEYLALMHEFKHELGDSSSQLSTVSQNRKSIKLTQSYDWIKTLSHLSGQGYFTINNMVYGDSHYSHVLLKNDARFGVLHNSLSLDIPNQGTISALTQLQIVNHQRAIWKNTFDFKHVDLAQITSKLNGQQQLAGVLNSHAVFDCQGKTIKQCTRFSSGHAFVNIKDGKIFLSNNSKLNKAQHLARLVQNLMMLKGHTVDSITSTNGGSRLVKYQALTAGFHLAHGVLNNDNLKVTSSKSILTGHGTVNLIDQTINYRATLASVKNSSQALPLRVTGVIQHPRISLDYGSLKDMLQKKLSSKTNTKKPLQNIGALLHKKIQMDHLFS